MLASVWCGISGFFGYPCEVVAEPVAEIPTRPSAPADTAAEAPSTPPAERTVYVPTIIDGSPQTGVTDATLNARLGQLASTLRADFSELLTFTGSGSAITALENRINTLQTTMAFMGRNEQLQGSHLTNVTASGISGLVDSDIPNNITASNYLPLAGGTLSGNLEITGNFTVSGAQTLSGAITIPYLIATSTTASSFVGNVGIGTTTPAATLDIYSSGSSLFKLTSSASFAQQEFTSFRNSAVTHNLISGRAARGTQAAPLAIQASDALLSIRASGWGTTGFSNSNDDSAGIDLAADENFTDATAAGMINFKTRQSGDTFMTSRVVIKGSGNVGIGTAVPDKKLEINLGTSDAFRLNYNDSNGSAANYADFTLNSSGNLNITPSGGFVGIGTTSPYAKLSVVGPVVAEYFHATSTTATSTFAGAISGPGSFTVQSSSGKVGIGTAIPEKQLHVAGTGDIYLVGSAPAVQFRTDVGNQALNHWDGDKYSVQTWNGSVWRSAFTIEQGALNNSLYVRSDGNVGIASTTPWKTFSVSGAVALAGLGTGPGAGALCLSSNNEVLYNVGAACTVSSERFKHNVETLSVGLDTVMALRPVSYLYNDNIGVRGVQLGLIAEEVNLIDPRLVVLDASSTPFTVKYDQLTALLVKAVQELAGQVKALSASAGGAIVDGLDVIFAAKIVVKNVEADTVTTHDATVRGNFCIGETCIDEQALKTIIEQTGANTVVSPDTPSAEPEQAPDTATGGDEETVPPLDIETPPMPPV